MKFYQGYLGNLENSRVTWMRLMEDKDFAAFVAVCAWQPRDAELGAHPAWGHRNIGTEHFHPLMS